MNTKSSLKRTAKDWTLDESILTDGDKIVLEDVGFPKHIKAGSVLIRRTQKRNVGRIGWIDKDRPEMSDIKYLTTSYKVAKYQVDLMTPHTKDSQGRPRSAEEIRIDVQKIEDMQTSKAFGQIYIDAENVAEELDALLSAFSSPKPTPSMKVSSNMKTEDIKFEETEVKKLSNKDKGVAKRMYKEETKSLEEITEVLGVEKKDRILAYIKTL